MLLIRKCYLMNILHKTKIAINFKVLCRVTEDFKDINDKKNQILSRICPVIL